MPAMLTNDPRVFPLTVPSGTGGLVVVEGPLEDATEVLALDDAVSEVEMVDDVAELEHDITGEAVEVDDAPEVVEVLDDLKC